MESVLLECAECNFTDRCSRVGASPIKAENGSFQCEMQAASEHGILVAVPARLGVSVGGKVVSVQMELVLFKVKRRGWWRRLLRIG